MGAKTASSSDDTYTDKVLKLIPADVVAVYLGVSTGFAAIVNPNNTVAQWVVFLIALTILPFFLRKVGEVTSRLQIILTMIAFVIWVMSIGGPLKGQLIAGYSSEFLASMILPFYTLFIPIVYEKS